MRNLISIVFTGLIAASAAHADAGSKIGEATPTEMLASANECSATEAILERLRYPTGTTFRLTDAGLVVLSQPRARNATSWEPEWPNTGN